MRFAKPFAAKSTFIYKSATGKIDTITFEPAKLDTAKVRSIEQGYYNQVRLQVSYHLSKGSYHKSTVVSIDNASEDFILISRVKGSHTLKEISFLGLTFDEAYVDRLLKEKGDVIEFNNNEARYKGLNINEGINSFSFDYNEGITSFIDKKGIEWRRQD